MFDDSVAVVGELEGYNEPVPLGAVPLAVEDDDVTFANGGKLEDAVL
jgi:hypothetical protein